MATTRATRAARATALTPRTRAARETVSGLSSRPLSWLRNPPLASTLSQGSGPLPCPWPSPLAPSLFPVSDPLTPWLCKLVKRKTWWWWWWGGGRGRRSFRLLLPLLYNSPTSIHSYAIDLSGIASSSRARGFASVFCFHFPWFVATFRLR